MQQLSANVLATSLSHELKQVGLVLNYRLCRLYLSLQRYSDALEQYNAHVAVIKRCVGVSDLLFSHYQYLSQQHHLFGDLLEQSNYHSTQRSKQFHAGYFYQTAATYAQKRKQYAQSLLTKIRNGTAPSLPSLVPAATLAPSAFLGQARLPYGSAALQDDRGVLGYSTMYVSSDPADLLRSVLSLEQAFDHSAQIIGLLNRSYDSYKREHSDRMIVHVASQIAAEYFSARNWEMAQKFFDRIAATYREEQWWTILTSTLMAAYHCAKELGKDMPGKLGEQEGKVAKAAGKAEAEEAERKRYEALVEQCRQLPRQLISYALELIGKYATTTTEQKEKIHTHLVDVLMGGGGVMPEHATDALDAVYELPVKYRLVECDAYFMTTPASVVYVLQPIDLVLKLDYRFPLPITAERVELQFNHPQYALTLTQDGSAAAQLTEEDDGSDKSASDSTPIVLQADNDGRVVTSLHFLPNRTKTFHIKLPARIPTSSPLAITHLVSHLLLRGVNGEQTQRTLRLRSWPNRREDEEVMRPVYGLEEVVVLTAKEKKKAKQRLANRSEEEKEEERRKLREEEGARARALSMKMAAVAIVPPLPAAVLSISHPSPPLLNEYYPLRVRIETRADDMRDAHIKVSSVDLQAAAAHKVTVDGLATQHVEGAEAKSEEKREEKEETKEADSSPRGRQSEAGSADTTRFYTLGRLTGQNAHVDSSELEEVTGPLLVPNMQPNSTYHVTLYVRLASSAPHHVFLDLSYTNADKFELSKREQLSLTAKPALSVKVKLFSERSVAVAASVPAEGRSVSLGDRCVLHVELDNVSSHGLALTDVRLDLAQQGVVEVTQASLWGGADRLTGGRLEDAAALFASRHTSSALLKPNASVFLSPGERYLHLFHFTAARAGRLTASAVGIQWCRVQVDLATARLHVAATPFDSRASGHALNEKQRDDLLKRLVEEQKVRAGGEQKAVPDTVKENGERSAAQREDGEHKPPVADETAVSDALKKELMEVEQEEKEYKENKGAADEMAGSVAVRRQPATPTSSAAVAATPNAANTPSTSSPCIPVELRQPLPPLTVAVPPVTAELVAPPVVSHGVGFPIRLSLRNNTGAVHDVEYAVRSEGVEGGAKVLLAGSTAGVCRLFPHSTAEVLWSSLSLETGFVPLPSVSAQLLSSETGQQPTVLVNPDEVGSVFVRTREKREQPLTAS